MLERESADRLGDEPPLSYPRGLWCSTLKRPGAGSVRAGLFDLPLVYPVEAPHVQPEPLENTLTC